MTEVIMPKMGDGMEEGTLLEWLKNDGDKVKSGQVIGSIQTDKATLELEAPASGYLKGILLAAGGTVPVGKAIALILKEGETVPSDWGSGNVSSSSSITLSQPEVTDVVTAASSSTAVVSTVSDTRVKASPLAKKIAAELGVDLASIQGSGPGGRIVQKDVTASTPAPVAAKVSAPAFAPLTATAEDSVYPLNKIRQITAKRTQESKQQVPHFYVTVEDLVVTRRDRISWIPCRWRNGQGQRYGQRLGKGCRQIGRDGGRHCPCQVRSAVQRQQIGHGQEQRGIAG